MDRMKDMVAIVTGGSRGLGRAIAKEYAREGARVVICARSQSPTGLPCTINETEEFRPDGGEVFAVPRDVTDQGQVEHLVQQVMERYGQTDVLFNNAGVMVLAQTLLKIEPEQWDQVIAANLRGPYLMCRSVVPVIIKQGRGSIINIGSRMGDDSSQCGGVLYSFQQSCRAHVRLLPGRRPAGTQRCGQHFKPRTVAE